MVGRGDVMWLAGGMHGWWGGCKTQGGHSWFNTEGACMPGGVHGKGGVLWQRGHLL